MLLTFSLYFDTHHVRDFPGKKKKTFPFTDPSSLNRTRLRTQMDTRKHADTQTYTHAVLGAVIRRYFELTLLSQ